MRKIIYLFIFFISLFLLNESISAYEEYNIGDVIKYEGIDFYVIKNSGSNDDSVTLLKAEPLLLDEIKEYLTSIDLSLVDDVKDLIGDGYGYMSYYRSDECKDSEFSGCTTDYSTSNVKKVVDAWTNDKIKNQNLVADGEGNYARLINETDLLDNLGLEIEKIDNHSYRINNDDRYRDWLYKSVYWTMVRNNSIENEVMIIDVLTHGNGDFSSGLYWGKTIYDAYQSASIRPVIILKKSALKKLDVNDITKEVNTNDANETKNDIVNVPNTMQMVSIVFIMIGIILASVSILLIIKNKNS